MAKTNQSSVPAFGMKDKLGYMFGDFGNDFTFILSSTFMMKFYTDVMGLYVRSGSNCKFSDLSGRICRYVLWI